MHVVVAKLWVLCVNLLQRSDNLANEFGHHLVGDAVTHLTYPVFQGSTVCVLCVHDHLLAVVENAGASVRKCRDWDKELLVKKLDWFRDVSRGNLVKSLLYVVFDASCLICSRKSLVRRRNLDNDFTLPGWIRRGEKHDTLLTRCQARHTWTNRLLTFGDIVHRTKATVGRSRGQLIPRTPVVRRVLKQTIHTVYEDFIFFPP